MRFRKLIVVRVTFGNSKYLLMGKKLSNTNKVTCGSLFSNFLQNIYKIVTYFAVVLDKDIEDFQHHYTD